MTPSSHETCLVIDKLTGRITSASPWLTEMLGFEAGELIGLHHAVLPPASRFAAGKVPWDAYQEFSRGRHVAW